MSLTSFLENNPDVRDRFRQEFAKPKFSKGAKILAPPLTANYGAVGTAFDYLFRFLIQQLNPHAVGNPRWVAELVVAKYLADKPELLAKGKKIISRARHDLSVFLKEGQIFDALIESALMLATLDPVHRKKKGHELIGIFDKDDLQDLKNLVSAVDRKTFTSEGLCLLNPTFGEASRLVSGADADLVLDETLIDIKTVKDLSLERNYFDQVLGYYVLQHIGGIGKLSLKPKITKVAIYFSRYGYLHVMPIAEIVDPTTFPSFIQWFQARAAEAFGACKPPEASFPS